MARDAAPAFVKAQKATPGQLEKIRKSLLQHRDLSLEITSGEETLKTKRENLRELEFKTLPDLFSQAGITNLGLEAEGNIPGYDAEKEPYYRANIAAAWPDEKRQAAFDYLEKHGGGDLIKTQITIMLPSKNTKLRKVVLAAVKKLKVPYEVNLSVPWASLTAFIREAITKKKQMPPLDLLGAEVGERVMLKPRKPAQ